MGKTIRLDKYLTEMNKGSRSQIKEAAKEGKNSGKRTDGKKDGSKNRSTGGSGALGWKTGCLSCV